MRVSLLFTLLIGCQQEASYDDGVVIHEGPAVEAVPPPANYMEFGVNGLNQGENAAFTAVGAPPGSTVTFLSGRRYGPGSCPPQLGQLCLQITGPVDAIGTAVADPQGVATYTSQVPNAGLGRTYAFEAVIGGRAPKISEPQEREIRVNGAQGPYGVGATYELSNLASVASNVLIGHPIRVTEAGVVTGMGCRGSAPSGGYKVALYDDNNNQPGSLVAETPGAQLRTGVNTEPVLRRARVAPGRYWLMSIYETGAFTYAHGASSPEWLTFIPFNGPIPATFQNGQYYDSPRINCFALIE